MFDLNYQDVVCDAEGSPDSNQMRTAEKIIRNSDFLCAHYKILEPWHSTEEPQPQDTEPRP